jgi:hypothetical protein
VKLSENLKACGFEGTTDDFKSLLLETLRTNFPTATIDSVLSTPAIATKYCETIRECFPDANLHDAIVLGTLMNIRRRKECPKKLIGGPSKVLLSKLLADGGCKMTVTAFRQLVAECLKRMCDGQSIHTVLCHPREALALCEYIRTKSQSDRLPHSLILKVLLSIRKN